MIIRIHNIVIRILVFCVAVLFGAECVLAYARDGNPAIISFDFCADQYALSLADPDQIVALSPDADGEYSYLRGQAQKFKKQRPLTEIILTQNPDAVLRQWGGSQHLMQQLRIHGVEAVQLDYASDVEGIIGNLTTVATELHQGQRLAKVVRRIHSQQQQIQKQAKVFSSIRALYVTPGGVTAAKGTLIDWLIRNAGLVNIATQSGAVGWPALPAEVLISEPPDLIIAGFYDSALERSANWSLAKHPVMKKLFRDIPTIVLPLDLISCAGPDALEVSLYLQAQLLEHHPEMVSP